MMAADILILFSLVACLIRNAESTVYYVDNAKPITGKGTGTLNSPFVTIKECVNSLRDAGDECQIRSGRYHEEIDITGLIGTPQKPFIITGYKDERPVLDGRTVITPVGGWKRSGNIYSAKISNQIWQLFLGDLMMTNARWPNAKWSDKSIFNGTKWSKLAKTSTRGHIINEDNSLKLTNINMIGAMAILNIGSYNTFVAKVKHHKAGSNEFTFDDTFGSYHFKTSISRYFLEDKIELLDAPEEWFYDKTSGVLSFYPPNGINPQITTVRGKVQSYAFSITNTKHLIIKNIDFFATTLRAKSENSTHHVNGIRFDSINFKYHTYSKRMLGDIGLIDWTDINGNNDKRRLPTSTWGKFTFFNNTFYGSDGVALSYYGTNVTIENNLFEYNDWTAANLLRAGGGVATIKSKSVFDVFKRNTLRYNGASVGIRPGRKSTITLNDISKQCWGIIQNDGSGVQVNRRPQYDALLEYNWVHDSPKYGLRFDGQPPDGVHGTMRYNVVCRCNGVMVKGDYHTVEHNLAFDKKNGRKSRGCTLCVVKYARSNPVEINMNTNVSSNIADVAYGGKFNKTAYWPLSGTTINNVIQTGVKGILMDPDNNDFRAVKHSLAASKKAGPYPYEENMKRYWLPGRKLYKTSTPIPPNESSTVNAIRRNAVMWLNAYDCVNHDVYFGNAEDIVEGADKVSNEFIGSVHNGDNVQYLPLKIEPGKTYYWRVDAVLKDVIYKGDVWSFSTI